MFTHWKVDGINGWKRNIQLRQSNSGIERVSWNLWGVMHFCLLCFFSCFLPLWCHGKRGGWWYCKISKEEVQKIIGLPDVTLIDVRYDKNWKKSDMKIASAVREHPNELGSWVGKYKKDQRLILYCNWPNEQTRPVWRMDCLIGVLQTFMSSKVAGGKWSASPHRKRQWPEERIFTDVFY